MGINKALQVRLGRDSLRASCMFKTTDYTVTVSRVPFIGIARTSEVQLYNPGKFFTTFYNRIHTVVAVVKDGG